MGTFQRAVRQFLGIDQVHVRLSEVVLELRDLNRRITQMANDQQVDYTALNRTLAMIGESGNKIADLITQLKNANAEGRQNEVDTLVQRLTPASDFLRGLAVNPTVEAVNDGTVVPNLPPVGGELPPQQDPATQDAASNAEQAGVGDGFGSPGEPSSI